MCVVWETLFVSHLQKQCCAERPDIFSRDNQGSWHLSGDELEKETVGLDLLIASLFIKNTLSQLNNIPPQLPGAYRHKHGHPRGTTACMVLLHVTLFVRHFSIYCMPLRTAASLMTPLPSLCLWLAAPLWQMYADFCSCALTCWLRGNETWDASSRLAGGGGAFRVRPQQGGSGAQMRLVCCSAWHTDLVLLPIYNILLWGVCNPLTLTPLNDWLESRFRRCSMHDHLIFMLY